MTDNLMHEILIGDSSRGAPSFTGCGGFSRVIVVNMWIVFLFSWVFNRCSLC